MNRIVGIVSGEIREALPVLIFFLVLFHLIALTKAASLDNYSITALRATGATVGALVVAKAILVVEALPIAHLPSGRRILQVLWKTLLYGVVVLLFRLIEEFFPLAIQHGISISAVKAFYQGISWPLFGVLALWILGGLFLYCLASETVRAVGPEKIREILFDARSKSSEC